MRKKWGPSCCGTPIRCKILWFVDGVLVRDILVMVWKTAEHCAKHEKGWWNLMSPNCTTFLKAKHRHKVKDSCRSGGAFMLLPHFSFPANVTAELQTLTQAAVTCSHRTHVALTARPISSTLRPVESPPGAPRAKEGVRDQSDPGQPWKREEELAVSIRREESGSEGGCRRGRPGHWQLFSER